MSDPAPRFVPGQRWQSLTEPELGLGVVEQVEGREVVVAYPARGITRRYASDAAPLARARLSPGQRVRAGDVSFRIAEVVEGDVLRYRGEGHELAESALDADLDVAMPENRVRTAQVDDHRLFDLRHDALRILGRIRSSPARGFLGGRIKLFDHQLSIARDVCERHRVRVLLADEVGLGKTIEALLILHRMLLTGRIERALVMTPPALVHQWLAEAWQRFHLLLRVIGRDTFHDAIDADAADLVADLENDQLFVCPFGTSAEDALLESSWDLLIVDEAHHLDPTGAAFARVRRLAETVDHVVLLSATPDRDGEEAHFRRLALLDPDRFHDFDAYRREAEHYRDLADTADRIAAGEAPTRADLDRLRERLAAPDLDDLVAQVPAAPEARRTLLHRLLDLHGIGRVMFRNVRARIPGFPRRVGCAVDLADGDPARLRREFLHQLGRDDSFRFMHADRDPRTAWLDAFLIAHPKDKVLALCNDRHRVEGFAGALERPKRPVARFHEEMSAIERDRQAAWFLADEQGPQLLISSAIGAEGRNFQVARHLVLLDLPLEADRLEQWIGRVDRIGQGAEIRVHAPTLPGTPQARLRRWHAEALRLFDRPWHGSPVIDREFGDALVDALLARDDGPIDALVAEGRRRNEQILGELERGRDRLLERTSFDAEGAARLRAAIDAAEEGPELEQFMLDAFERAGLEIELLGERSYALRPGPEYHRPFPGFHGQEMSVSFDRESGLRHPDRRLLSFDHPMVRDTLDTLLSRETGNAAIARRTGPEPALQIEALFVAEPTVARALRADRFFPPTPLRVHVGADGEEIVDEDGGDPGDAVDARGADLDARWRASLRPIDAAILKNPHVEAKMRELLARAREIADARAPTLVDAARRRMRRELEPAVARLRALAAVNPSVTADEVAAEEARLLELDAGLERARVRLDAIRLVVVAPG